MSCGKGVPSSVSTSFLKRPMSSGPILGGKLRIELEAFQVLFVLEDLLEQLVVEAENHVGIHLDEAAIGVVGEPPISGAPRQTLDGPVVEAEIEHGVHHARHRGPRARAHRNEQRIVFIAKARADGRGDRIERGLHPRFQLLGELSPEVVVDRAKLGGDGEAGRDRKPEPRHLGEVSALAAEPIAIGRRAVGAAAAEAVDQFRRGRGGFLRLDHRMVHDRSAVVAVPRTSHKRPSAEMV